MVSQLDKLLQSRRIEQATDMPVSTAYALVAFMKERKAKWLWFFCGFFTGIILTVAVMKW